MRAQITTDFTLFSDGCNNRAHFQALAGDPARPSSRRVNLAHLPALAIQSAAVLSSIVLCPNSRPGLRDTGCTAAGRPGFPVALVTFPPAAVRIGRHSMAGGR
jgi:hypothetical protein